MRSEQREGAGYQRAICSSGGATASSTAGPAARPHRRPLRPSTHSKQVHGATLQSDLRAARRAVQPAGHLLHDACPAGGGRQLRQPPGQLRQLPDHPARRGGSPGVRRLHRLGKSLEWCKNWLMNSQSERLCERAGTCVTAPQATSHIASAARHLCTLRPPLRSSVACTSFAQTFHEQRTAAFRISRQPQGHVRARYGQAARAARRCWHQGALPLRKFAS